MHGHRSPPHGVGAAQLPARWQELFRGGLGPQSGFPAASEPLKSANICIQLTIGQQTPASCPQVTDEKTEYLVRTGPQHHKR